MYKDRELVRSLVRRAIDAGFEALVYTADLPLLGQRDRDLRNAFTVPLRPNARLLWDVIRCPRWSLGILTHGIPRMQNFVHPGRTSLEALAALTTSNMDASVEWSSVAWLRDIWPKKIVLKGLLSPEDAETATRHGFDAIVVSNHGGRQLDSAVSTISQLAAIADAVGGRAEVYMDGGIRRGTSIAKALALGARAVLLGRATLYGVGANGEAGADRALSILKDELDRCLALIGCAAAGRLDRSYVALQ
jgi:(S)-mandelate dehydrogenase